MDVVNTEHLVSVSAGNGGQTAGAVSTASPEKAHLRRTPAANSVAHTCLAHVRGRKV